MACGRTNTAAMAMTAMVAMLPRSILLKFKKSPIWPRLPPSRELMLGAVHNKYRIYRIVPSSQV